MKTQLLAVMFALTLSTLACELQSAATGASSVVSSSTPTATDTPSSTPTNTPTFTPIPPTRTPRPTDTPTPRISEAIVISPQIVRIRIKPCYQAQIGQAEPGARFRATGWFRSNKGEEWVRIAFRRDDGSLGEGWIYGPLVEVTNRDLIYPVPEYCFNTPTHTPTVTPTLDQPPTVHNAYIRLYQHESFSGVYIQIPITACGRVNIDTNSPLHDAVSSFDLFAPENVQVALAEHHIGAPGFPGRSYVWQGNNGHLKVNMAALKAWGLHDVVSSISWFVDGQPVRSTCQF